VNELLYKKATKTRTTKPGQDIKALHLADTAFEGAVGDDPDGFVCRPSEQNDTLRPCILARRLAYSLSKSWKLISTLSASTYSRIKRAIGARSSGQTASVMRISAIFIV
jgi:hypothetical protein